MVDLRREPVAFILPAGAGALEVENRTAGLELAAVSGRPPEAMFVETPRFTLSAGTAAKGDSLDALCCERAKAIFSESMSLVPLVGRISDAPPTTPLAADDTSDREFKDTCPSCLV